MSQPCLLDAKSLESEGDSALVCFSAKEAILCAFEKGDPEATRLLRLLRLSVENAENSITTFNSDGKMGAFFNNNMWRKEKALPPHDALVK